MSTQAPALPTWKDLYDRTEQFWTAPLQAFLGTPTAASMMSTTREQFLTQNKVTREAFETTWAALRLPSLADHARLAGQVVALEAKVEGLEDKLDAISAQLEQLIASNKKAAKAGSHN